MTPEEIAQRKQDWSNAVQHFKQQQPNAPKALKEKEIPVSPFIMSRFQVMLNQDTHLALKTWCVQNQRDLGEVVDMVMSEWVQEQYNLKD